MADWYNPTKPRLLKYNGPAIHVGGGAVFVQLVPKNSSVAAISKSRVRNSLRRKPRLQD